MTVETILTELAVMGSESTKNTFLNHGAKGQLFGVKVQDLKTIQKKVKKNYELSLALYETGNSDAMYLAGLIADETKMTKADLENWVQKATWYMISEYTVPWIAAESNFGLELALKWITSETDMIAAAGWATLSNLVLIKPDPELNIALLSGLLDQVAATIHHAPNRVRYTMNGFVIAVGSAVKALNTKAKETANAIGKVSVFMGKTACKVPEALVYIEKVEKMGKLGNKKKMARC